MQKASVLSFGQCAHLKVCLRDLLGEFLAKILLDTLSVLFNYLFLYLLNYQWFSALV